MDARRIFSDIYAADRWNGGSGPGSRPDFVRPLVAWLRRYLAAERIGSLVDLGCGDLQWMPEALEGTGVRYCGVDVVPELLERHRRRLPGWEFREADVATVDPATLPDADLYWAKDVLQHWTDELVDRFLGRFFEARPAARLVVVNCAGQVGPRQLDARHHFAPLSLSEPPLARHRPTLLFHWGGKEVVRLSHSARQAA